MAEFTRIERHKAGFILLFLLLISSSIPVNLEGQNDEIQNFISNTIPVDNQNWEVFQSPVTGYLYFANSAGLVEYNGISSRIYQLPFRQGIRSVYINSSGTIFTGSFEDFGYWECEPEKELIYHSLAQKINIPKNDEIWNTFENGGSVFFQSFTTIYKYDTTGVKAIPGPSILLFMFQAGDKFVVQALGLGLFWFDGSGFSFISHSELFSSVKVHAVIPKGHGVLYG